MCADKRSLWSFAGTPARKTAAEKYADDNQLQVPVPIRRSQSTQSTITTFQNTDPDATIKLNVHELDTLLKSKLTLAPTKSEKEVKKKEKKVKRKDADESRCLYFPCKVCKIPKKGILHGVKHSIPKKLHIIQHWKKQLNSRVPKKKFSIVVDNNPEMNITYQELDEFSNSIAFHLRQIKFSGHFENHNPNGEVIISVVHPPCYEYIVILLAILKLGAAFLPISYDLPAERIASIIKLTRPVLTIITSEEQELFTQVGNLVDLDVMHVDEIWSLLEKGQFDRSLLPFKYPIQSPDPTKPYPPMWKRTVVVTVIPSDTQELQAVSYDSRAFFNRIEWENHFFVYFSSEYVLLPPHFDTINSIADIITPLCIGCTLVVLQSPMDYLIPDQLLVYCHTYKVRRLTLWPTLLKACCTSMELYDEMQNKVNTVRYWFCIGGFLSAELSSMFFEYVPSLTQLVHMYQYEDCLGALAFQIFEFGGLQNQTFYSRLPVGFPVPNMDIYILGADRLPVPDGTTGEIYVSGMQLPNITRENIAQLDNKYYSVNPFSRKKDKQVMIGTKHYGKVVKKKNGQRILIHESTRSREYYIDDQIVWLLHIDMHLARMPNLVKNSHTMCYRPNEDEQVLLAFCVFASPTVTPLAVEDELKNSIPLFMIPEVVQIDEIPVFETNKYPEENQLLKLYQALRSARKIFHNWNVLNIPSNNTRLIRASKILAYIIFTYLGTPISEIVEHHWNHPFLSLRRASVTKGICVVKELHKNRYPIFPADLLWPETLHEVADKMVVARQERGHCTNNCQPDEIYFIKNRYKLDVMVNSNRVSICSLLARCFTQRDQLDYYAEISYADLRKFFDSMWSIFVSKKLSIVVRKKKDNNKLVGAVMNMSWHDEIEITRTVLPHDIFYKLELIHFLEQGITDTHFPQDKTHVLQVCFVGLDSTVLTSYEIHGLTDKIIRCMLVFAKVRGFEALVIITYDFYSTDICINNYHFHVAKECQVNQFVASDGLRPYALCPDQMIATLCWKHLHSVQEIDSSGGGYHQHHSHNAYHSDKIRKSFFFASEHKKPWSS